MIRTVTTRFAQNLCPALTVALALAVAGPGVLTAEAGQSDRRFLDRLNEPILRLSEHERAYRVYFEAYEVLDVGDDRLAAALIPLDPASAAFHDAIGWAGEPSQQEAVEILLRRGPRGGNATERLTFGLPYGTEHIPDDMEIFDFVVYLRDGQLYDRDLAYLPRYRELMALLRAEAFRRAEEGNTSGAVEAILGLARMARHLCNQEFYDEKVEGINELISALVQIREFMWHYRDRLTVENFRNLALGVERLDVIRIELPRGEELIGEQLIEQVFGPDNFIDNEKFPRVMGRFETVSDPLNRFQAVAKWQQLAGDHASKLDVQHQLRNAVANWRMRWRLLHHQPPGESDFARLDDRKYAAVKHSVRDLEGLFPLRLHVLSQQHGTAATAGLLAWVRREGGRLVPGELGNQRVVPQRLSQIQPAYVNSERMLIDPYSGAAEQQLRYHVIRRRDMHLVTQGYEINTPTGRVHIPEFWPLLYSIGPDGRDNVGPDQKHMTRPGPEDRDVDIIFFPPLDILVREGRR